jgi:hypothetical protein
MTLRQLIASLDARCSLELAAMGVRASARGIIGIVAIVLVLALYLVAPWSWHQPRGNPEVGVTWETLSGKPAGDAAQ